MKPKKPLYSNQVGSVSLIGLTMMLALLSVIVMNITKLEFKRQNIVHEINHLLCLKSRAQNLQDYHSSISSLNKKILLLQPLKLSPKTRPMAVAGIKSLMRTQNLRHFKYLKGSLKNAYCKTERVLGLKQLPYGTVLKRKLDDTARLRNKRISLYITSKDQKSLLTRMKFQIKGRLSSKIKISVISLESLKKVKPFLNPFSG
ncbi:MAG: hypothetical protein ACPGJV_04005 [Bacteriovoracaceae bacterium]